MSTPQHHPTLIKRCVACKSPLTNEFVKICCHACRSGPYCSYKCYLNEGPKHCRCIPRVSGRISQLDVVPFSDNEIAKRIQADKKVPKLSSQLSKKIINIPVLKTDVDLIKIVKDKMEGQDGPIQSDKALVATLRLASHAAPSQEFWRNILNERPQLFETLLNYVPMFLRNRDISSLISLAELAITSLDRMLVFMDRIVNPDEVTENMTLEVAAIVILNMFPAARYNLTNRQGKLLRAWSKNNYKLYPIAHISGLLPSYLAPHLEPRLDISAILERSKEISPSDRTRLLPEQKDEIMYWAPDFSKSHPRSVRIRAREIQEIGEIIEPTLVPKTTDSRPSSAAEAPRDNYWMRLARREQYQAQHQSHWQRPRTRAVWRPHSDWAFEDF